MYIYLYMFCFLQGTMSQVIRNIEAELVVSQISPPSITFLQFQFLREISVDNHQATKQSIIILTSSPVSLLGREEIFVNRLQDGLDSLHYDHGVAIFLTLMNTAVTNGLRYIIVAKLRIDLSLLTIHRYGRSLGLSARELLSYWALHRSWIFSEATNPSCSRRRCRKFWSIFLFCSRQFW